MGLAPSESCEDDGRVCLELGRVVDPREFGLVAADPRELGRAVEPREPGREPLVERHPAGCWQGGRAVVEAFSPPSGVAADVHWCVSMLVRSSGRMVTSWANSRESALV